MYGLPLLGRLNCECKGRNPEDPYVVALRKDGTITVGHVPHTIFAAIPFFAAYFPTTARSLALILRYLSQLLGPSLLLTLDAFINSLFTESIVDCDTLLKSLAWCT